MTISVAQPPRTFVLNGTTPWSNGLHTLVSTPPDVAADISDNGEVTLRHAV